MFNKRNMDSGTQPILKEKDWSHLSLKTNVYQQPVFTLKDGRKVGLNPKLTKAHWEANYE
jgi:hypothetical protein